MKNIIIVAIVMLGMISCEKVYNYPVEGESFGNYEYHTTMIKFDSNSVVSITVSNSEDSILIVNYGIYTQMDDKISIDLGGVPYLIMNGVLSSDYVLTMHVGTDSQTTFWRIRE